MTLTAADLGRLAQLTLSQPARAAQAVMALNVPRDALWLCLALVTVAGVLISALGQGPVMTMPIGAGGTVVVGPFGYALILGASLVLTIFALHYTGGMLGGTGRFDDALALIAWLEAVAVAVRFVADLAALLSLTLATVVSLAGLGLLLWALLNFINELHRFDSIGRSLLTLFLAMVGIAVGLSLILSIIGVGSGGGVAA